MNVILFGEMFPMFTMTGVYTNPLIAHWLGIFLCTETSRQLVVAPLVRRLW